MRKNRAFHASLVCLPLVFCLAGCGPNAAGRQSLALLPQATVERTALQAYAEEKQKTPLAQNAHQTAVLRRVADNLIAVAKLNYGVYVKGFAWEVVLFDKPDTVNAWCMPGGKMAVYTGILPVCEDEAGLAFILGHEMGHAILKHGNERMSQQLALAGGLAGLGLALERGTELSEEWRKAILLAAGAGGELGISLPFSRAQEYEADRMGVRLMALAGYDPARAPQLWEKMESLGGGNGGQIPPQFLSTHPSHRNRVEELRQMQAEARRLYEGAPVKYGNGQRL